MGNRVMAAAAVVIVLAAVGCGGGAGLHSTVSAKLTGTEEAPKGSASGSGTAVVRLNAKAGTACWTLRVRGIGNPLSAHIHKGDRGETGPVVIPLGARFAAKGCVLAPKTSLVAVAKSPGAYYVNVHTRKYLNGAVRGQLHR